MTKETKSYTHQEHAAMLSAEIAAFPSVFGLAAWPGETFRIGARESYFQRDTASKPLLYTQRWDAARGVWLDHAKGTPDELRRQITKLAEPPKLTPKQRRTLEIAFICQTANGVGCLRGSQYRALETKGLAYSLAVARKRVYTLTPAGMELGKRLRAERRAAIEGDEQETTRHKCERCGRPLDNASEHRCWACLDAFGWGEP